MSDLPLILLAIVAFAIGIIVSSYQSKKKFLALVRDSFGKTPTKLDYSLDMIPTYYDSKQEYEEVPPLVDETGL